MLSRIKFFLLFVSISFCGFILLISLTSCKPLEKDEIMQSFLPNVWVFLSHLLASVILLIFCIWLVWKPTKDSLKARHDYIQKQIDEALEAKQKSVLILAEAERTRNEAFNQSKQIIEQATVDAYANKEKIEAQAHLNARHIIDDAKKDSSKIEMQIRSQVKDEIVELAISAASALLKKEVNTEDNERFVDDFIQQLETHDK